MLLNYILGLSVGMAAVGFFALEGILIALLGLFDLYTSSQEG